MFLPEARGGHKRRHGTAWEIDRLIRQRTRASTVPGGSLSPWYYVSLMQLFHGVAGEIRHG